ncbi:MAG: transporter substrate-binding domain-containing protein [Atopobiaceae bacterium]|nr:transporter substrate-binding domain-containing protein [Atopobiaceae bacterium]
MKLSMNRREFLAAFGTVAASAVLAGCGGSNASAVLAGSASKDSGAADDKSATATKKLIVGFDSAYPPYGYVGDDGQYTGFDLELAQETAKRNSWDVQLEPIDWDAKDTLMDSGAINCIWNGFTVEGRENDYTFSGNYMINAQVIVVKKGAGITDFAGLSGKTVITQTDSAAYEVLAGDDAAKADVAATFASLETIGDYNTAFMQLESGAVDAVACDLSIAAYQLAAKPDAYQQLDEKLSEEHYAVGFKKGDEATADTVTETLKAMDKDGFVKDLCEKYADQGISYSNWCLA